jgi:hypothetical protein
MTSLNEEAFYREEYLNPYTLAAGERAYVLSLSKKDFSEILYYRHVEQKAEWVKFL